MEYQVNEPDPEAFNVAVCPQFIVAFDAEGAAGGEATVTVVEAQPVLN